MSNKISIFSISAEQLRINEMLEESGGELTPEIEEALLINEGNFLVKAEGYIETIAKYKAMGEACAERIKQLQAYKKTCENIEKRLKESLTYGMTIMERDKMEIGLHRISFRNSTSVDITNEASIPNEYILVETKVDKRKLGEALKSGETIPGAQLVTNKSIQIR